jgi:hypothetical protein
MRAAITKILGGVALLALPAAAQAVDMSTLVHWTSGTGANGHSYALTSAASDFATAEADAVAAGGQLVSIGSAEENAFLVSAFHMVNNDQNSAYWIGLVNPHPETGVAGFQWLDGSPVSYMHWDGSQPDNCGCDGTDHGQYVAINAFGSVGYSGAGVGGWSDEGLNGYNLLNGVPNFPIHGIVEFNSDGAVPEPASWALMVAGFGLAGGALRTRKAKAAFV